MKLPEIFKNKLDERINNNKRIFIGEADNQSEDIFNKLPVRVKLITNKGDKITCTIVGKTTNYLITKNRNVIYMNDIKEIKRA